MGTEFQGFSDLEDDIVNGEFKPEMRRESAVDAKTQKFPCMDCHGTGRYMGRRVNQHKSNCFACQGRGYFLTSERDRRKASQQRRARKANVLTEFREAHKDLLVSLGEISNWNSFAASMIEQARTKPLTDNQIAACERMLVKIAQKNEQRQKEQEENKNDCDLQPIRDMFETAVRNGYKRPTYRAEGLVISRAPDTGKNPGALYVKNEKDQYGGKVVGAEFYPSRDGQDSYFAERGTAGAALMYIAADPLAAALRYGQRTGRCACCGRELRNHTSIDLGIGPICREKWGL